MLNNFYEYGRMLYAAFTAQAADIYVPTECVNVCRKVCAKLEWNKTRVHGVEANITAPGMAENNKIMLALSGGLDSTYLLYQLLEQGLDVVAVYVAGLNKEYTIEESRQAARIARKAGAKFTGVKCNAPRQAFVDNPFKNQLILSIMLDVGIKNGIYRYAVGSDWGTPLSEAVAGYTITDSIEVNRAFWDGIKAHFPQAELIFIGNEKKQERLAYLHKKSVLKDVSSCIAPHRFRQHWHDENIKKYGVALMPGRCGSCYKCSMEYLLLADKGLIKPDKAYIEHCWHILATSKTSHRPDLFGDGLPISERLENLRNYGS